VYYFDSIELRDAFMYGVNEASGWMEYLDLTEVEYKDYLKHSPEGGRLNGLDTTHECWHGAYSAFNRWRMRWHLPLDIFSEEYGGFEVAAIDWGIWKKKS